jgi:hypothetical protein
MKKIFENRIFDGVIDRDSGATYSDMLFSQCVFRGCVISHTHHARLRSVVKNVVLHNCQSVGSTLESAVVEQCVIDGLKTNELLQCWGSVFSETIVKGKVGRLMLSDIISPGVASKSEQLIFQMENDSYYSKIEWALDISQIEAEDVDIRGIPANLIRRDPDTQVVITREEAMQGTWTGVDLSNTYWPTAIKLFLNRGHKDIVLVAPRRHKKFRALQTGLIRLREAGIAV